MTLMTKIVLTVAAVYALFALFHTWDDDSNLERALNFAVIPTILMALADMWSHT
jgi:hypothetical protein